MTATQPGQIPCPSCSRPLALPVEAVLTGQAIVCAACGLELTAQRSASRDALESLGRWYEETGEARKVAAAGRTPDAPSENREASRRARRPRR